jgi:multidrug resistance efflux pump
MTTITINNPILERIIQEKKYTETEIQNKFLIFIQQEFREEKVKLLISHTLVRSPVSGFIAKKWKEVGDFVSPGLPVYSVYSPKSFYVLAWIDEDKVPYLKVGTVGRVELAACGGRSFKAKVLTIGRSAGSVFALIPKDTSEGEYTRVVQRVPVKIEVDGVPLYCVKPGTNVTVYLKKERRGRPFFSGL